MSQDPTALPLPAAIGLPCVLFLLGAFHWVKARSRGQMSDGNEQILHGLWMTLFGFPLGLLIPYAIIPKAVSLAHGVALLQGVFLIAMGSIWHSHFGFVSGERLSVIAKWFNLYGFWFNLFGILWGAFTGAKDLFYLSKGAVDFQASPEFELVLHFLLKSQGICNLIAFVIVIHQFTQRLIAFGPGPPPETKKKE